MSVVTQFPAARDRESELRFQAMFEGAAIGIGICQLDGRMLEANAALGRMLGYSPQELTGTHAGDFFPEFVPTSMLKFTARSAAKFFPIIFRRKNDCWASCLGALAAPLKSKRATGAKTAPNSGDT
jgi:PAS domain-containing protein